MNSYSLVVDYTASMVYEDHTHGLGFMDEPTLKLKTYRQASTDWLIMVEAGEGGMRWLSEKGLPYPKSSSGL